MALAEVNTMFQSCVNAKISLLAADYKFWYESRSKPKFLLVAKYFTTP